MTSIEHQTGPFIKMAGNDTTQLQRAIFAQYIMMKKLFMELEEEREASATAASAAMSMIRKLQKEKDEERMEAWQYKRIAEEKINHTDRAVEILKEVMELKELEISHLRNKLQAYKHKLLDVGIDDSDIIDETISSNITFESRNMENICCKIKRNFSLPTLRFNKLYADMDIKQNGGVQSARSRWSGDGWEQISRDGIALEPMKTLSTDVNSTEKQNEEPKSPNGGGLHDSKPLDESSCSSFSAVSHQVTEDVEYTVNHDRPKDSCLDTETGEVAAHPLSGVDPHQIPERSNATTDSSCTESEVVKEGSELSPTVVTKGRGPRTLSRFAATRKIGSMNNVDRHVHRSSGSYTPRAGVERTRSRLKRVQSAKMVELNDPRSSKEQIIMLKEVYEQLGMIESHMRPSDSQESPRNDTSLDSVMEVFLLSLLY
ncbi:hypothetical protein HU200_005347 [Digitaria exilis]|uniref:GTD-binding domain-containing protein n=1 Tax=Digitaria exilis TaxID=1010633 RepID=A0A835FUS7_9POAL|nr:hypothetical protein HU200_005347 [Digitaria exilis]